MYDHPTPPGFVSRLTALAFLDGTLYAGLAAFAEDGVKLLRMTGGTLRPVPGWPSGAAVDVLTAHWGRVYGVNATSEGSAVWRTDGTAVERIRGLDGERIRAMATGPSDVWAVSARRGGGTLWRSGDGVSWTAEQSFQSAEPLDVTVYAGRVYVGTLGPGGRGTLWGPPAPAPAGAPIDTRPIPPAPRRLAPEQLAGALAVLDRALGDVSSYAEPGARLEAAVEPLALSGLPPAGSELARRLTASFPDAHVRLFGGALSVPAAALARWHLLWAVALNGHGRVPLQLLTAPWTAPPNAPEKYLEPAPAAAWAVAQVGQADAPTLGAMIDRLGSVDQPAWLDGDLVGALTVLTGKRFGYDLAGWRQWWARHRSGGR